MAGDAVWRRILGRVRKLDGAHVRVGVLASKGGEAEHSEADNGITGGITLTELAAIHEFGSPAANIPQRSFIRRALIWNSGPWLPAFVTKLAGAVLAEKMTEAKALALLGTKAVAEVKKTITGSDVPPPLQPSTIARKGSSKPLVDTGQLLNAIQYEVVLE